jgi:hypothetical protein
MGSVISRTTQSRISSVTERKDSLPVTYQAWT